jgi:hypothetical protein
MNVEIGAEATLFPEKEYINGIAVAVCAADAAFRAKQQQVAIPGWLLKIKKMCCIKRDN